MNGARRLAVGLVTVGALTAGCSSQEVDLEVVQDTIRDGIRDQTGETVRLECPSQVDWRVGGDFRCVATVASDGSTAIVIVNMENEAGDITWQIG